MQTCVRRAVAAVEPVGLLGLCVLQAHRKEQDHCNRVRTVGDTCMVENCDDQEKHHFKHNR